MATSTIGTVSVTFRAGQQTRFTVSPITFPAGRTTADFADFVCTVREDPQWDADTGRRRALDTSSLDPAGDGWPIVASAVGVVESATGVYFDFAGTDLELGAGYRRYVIDAVGEGGTAGPVMVFDTNWLTLLPRVTPF